MALQFTAKLEEKCELLAAFDGKPFPTHQDLGSRYYFTVYNKNYLIFFRYEDDMLIIVRIVERHRNLRVLFRDKV